jgi:hypothetical protein
VTPFTYVYLIAGVLCAWAILRCMGNERDRKTREMEERIAAEDRAQAEKDVLTAIAAANASSQKSNSNGTRRAA